MPFLFITGCFVLTFTFIDIGNSIGFDESEAAVVVIFSKEYCDFAIKTSPPNSFLFLSYVRLKSKYQKIPFY